MYAIADNALSRTQPVARRLLIVSEVPVPEFKNCPCWDMQVANSLDASQEVRRPGKVDCLCILIHHSRLNQVKEALGKSNVSSPWFLVCVESSSCGI